MRSTRGSRNAWVGSNTHGGTSKTRTQKGTSPVDVVPFLSLSRMLTEMTTPSTLVIRHLPWLEAFIGIAFITAGMWPFFSGERVFGGAFMVTGAALVLFIANVETTQFDRSTHLMTKRVKGAVRRSEVTHPIADIAAVRVVQSPGSGNSPSPRYRLVLMLKSGNHMTINAGYSAAKADKERLASEIRAFLNLPEPIAGAPPSFGEMMNAIRGSK